MIYIFRVKYRCKDYDLHDIIVESMGDDCNKAKDKLVKSLPKDIDIGEIILVGSRKNK